VVGNSDYSDLIRLPNAVNDARRIGEVLTKANFEVVVGEDLSKAELEKVVRDFLRSLNDGDVALFYYSGHAVQVAGENFILPVDANLSSSYDLELESYNISNLLDYMRESSSLQILVLDACRDNPFRSEHYYLGDQRVAVENTQGLASLVPRQGSLIVYSTAPNQVAFDGAGDLSPFSASLADNVLTPNVEVRHLLTDIRADVIRRTNGRQVPWDVSSLTSPFYFVTQQNMVVVSEALTEVRASPRATGSPAERVPRRRATLRTSSVVGLTRRWTTARARTAAPSRETRAVSPPRSTARGFVLRSISSTL
jgi:uncharacterized caspase-like protein